MNKKIPYLDGLKAFSCLGVFLHHFLLSFYPATYFGSDVPLHSGLSLEYKLSSSPFSFFIVGNYLVCIFILVSSFLISYQLLNKGDENYCSKFMLKRYLRLMLPILFTCFTIFVLSKFKLFDNKSFAPTSGSSWLVSFDYNHLNFRELLRNAFYSILFCGDSQFCNAFWMLNYIFIGSFLSMILIMAAKKSNKRILIVYVLLALYCIKENSYYATTVLGVILAYIYYHYNSKFKNNILGICILLIGIFFGAYPTHGLPRGIYSPFYLLPEGFVPYIFYHIIGAFFTVTAFFISPALQKIFSFKFWTPLSNLSFGLYLIHIPILYTISTRVFKLAKPYANSYSLTVLITFVITTVVVMLLSYLFNKYIEKWCSTLSNKILNLFYA